MRGDAMWSALRFVLRTGEVGVVAMGSDGKLASQPVLPPAGDPASMAYHIAPQMEGYAAARVRINYA